MVYNNYMFTRALHGSRIRWVPLGSTTPVFLSVGWRWYSLNEGDFPLRVLPHAGGVRDHPFKYMYHAMTVNLKATEIDEAHDERDVSSTHDLSIVRDFSARVDVIRFVRTAEDLVEIHHDVSNENWRRVLEPRVQHHVHITNTINQHWESYLHVTKMEHL